jgi:hypothetical protein
MLVSMFHCTLLLSEGSPGSGFRLKNAAFGSLFL